MLTREQIEEIQSESREKGLSIKKLLEEKGIPAHQYFWWKRKYVREQIAEGFLPVAGAMPPSVMSGMPTCGAPRGKSKAAPAAENWMSIELRTVAGTDMCNAKVKAFRSQFRGVSDIPFFIFRLSRLLA